MAQPRPIVVALLFTAAALALGYTLLGLLPMLLFAFGFLGGLLLWILVPGATPFSAMRGPYFLTLSLFVLHKLEERYLDFFPALSRITGVPVPDTSSVFVVLLYALAAAWLLIPFLVSRTNQFGYYLAWTFFTSMGVVELAHFIFPLLQDGPYGYFPGMATALFLAPAAWWGLYRLAHATPPATS